VTSARGPAASEGGGGGKASVLVLFLSFRLVRKIQYRFAAISITFAFVAVVVSCCAEGL